MLQAIAIIFPLIFTNNLVISLVKVLAAEAATKTWIRVTLGILSVAGIVSVSALSGTPVDFNSISSLAQTTTEAAVLAIASHFSYKVIKGA